MDNGGAIPSTVEWVDRQLTEAGEIPNPADLFDYPLAPWWKDKGHTFSLSLIGNLNKLGLLTKAPPATRQRVLAKAARYAATHYPLDVISKNDWLFMAYRPFDYYMNVSVEEAEVEDIEPYREAVIKNLNACALAHESQAELQKLFPLLQFVNRPDSAFIPYLEGGLIDRVLDHLQASQQEDGTWADELVG